MLAYSCSRMEIQKEFGLQSNRKPGARLIRDPDRNAWNTTQNGNGQQGYSRSSSFGFCPLRLLKWELAEFQSPSNSSSSQQRNSLDSRDLYEEDLIGCVFPASVYCWSYTAVLVYFLPWASVPCEVTVRLLPSSDTTILPVVVTVVPFFTRKSNS